MNERNEEIEASGDNRSRLLQLAAELFAEAGYASISVRDLAGRLGLTTGAVYSNFQSKGDLLAEVLDMHIRMDMERERPEIGLPEFVKQSFIRMRERAMMRALLVEAATAARTDSDLQKRLYPTLCTLLDRWVADYRDWQSIRHVDRRLDMDALVRSLWSIELGLGVLDAQGALRVKPPQMATFVSAYLDSLETTDGPLAKKGDHRPLHRHRVQTLTRDSSVAPRSRLTAVAALRDSPKAAATQARLMEAASDLFATKGYSSVTVRDLARATSMTTGSIYGNFANKAVLLVEVAEARIGEDLEQLPESLIASGSPAELVEFNLTTFDTRVQLRALLLEGAAASRSDSDVKSRLRSLQRGRLNRWAQSFDEWATRTGITPAVDTLTAVTAVWSAELGQGLLEAFGLATTPPTALANTFGDMFRVAGFDDSVVTPKELTSRRRVAR